MSELIEFLSGEIPGGILILLILLITINLTLKLLKTSQVISPKKSRKKQISYSIIVILIYITLWFGLKPSPPQIRIMVIPTIQNDEFHLNAQSFEFAELMQRYAFNNLADKYFMHRWEWLFETIGKDSVSDYDYWKSIAHRMNAGIIIESFFVNDTYQCVVHDYQDKNGKDVQKFSAAGKTSLTDVINQLNKEYKMFQPPFSSNSFFSINYLDAKIAYYNHDYNRAQSLLENEESVESKVLLAAIYMQKGLAFKRDRIKAQYAKIKNKEFEQAKSIIYPLISRRQDTPESAYILGRIALREEDYENVELFLKKALVDDPENCRIHYALSHLLSVRLKELGYKSRIEILEKAVELDPGYRNAVYELSSQYYSTGTGTQIGIGTTNAMHTMEAFLKIKSDDPQILSLLASIYLKTDRLDEAFKIFCNLQKRFPDDSNAYYNLGSIYFYKKEYQKALEYFFKAIEIDQNLDAYLYVGITYSLLGKRDLALKYYRERVRRKTGDDDKYAKEAMKGIRKILEEIEDEKMNEK